MVETAHMVESDPYSRKGKNEDNTQCRVQPVLAEGNMLEHIVESDPDSPRGKCRTQRSSSSLTQTCNRCLLRLAVRPPASVRGTANCAVMYSYSSVKTAHALGKHSTTCGRRHGLAFSILRALV